MKVTPMRQKANKMNKYSKADQYFVFAIHTLTVCLGVSPFKFNKQTGEISFKWFSFETIWSLVRLLVFNAPFSFLPVILMFFFGEGEWEPEERSRFVNVTSQHVSKSTVFMAVVTVEYVSCYSYFILFRAAKKLNVQLWLWSLKGSNGKIYKAITPVRKCPIFYNFINGRWPHPPRFYVALFSEGM